MGGEQEAALVYFFLQSKICFEFSNVFPPLFFLNRGDYIKITWCRKIIINKGQKVMKDSRNIPAKA